MLDYHYLILISLATSCWIFVYIMLIYVSLFLFQCSLTLMIRKIQNQERAPVLLPIHSIPSWLYRYIYHKCRANLTSSSLDSETYKPLFFCHRFNENVVLVKLWNSMYEKSKYYISYFAVSILDDCYNRITKL